MASIIINNTENPISENSTFIPITQKGIGDDVIYSSYQKSVEYTDTIDPESAKSWVTNINTTFNPANSHHYQQSATIVPNIGQKGTIELSSDTMSCNLLHNGTDISENHNTSKVYEISGENSSKLVCRLNINETINKIQDGENSGDQRSAIINLYFKVPDDATDGTRKTSCYYNIPNVSNKIEQKSGADYHHTYDNIQLIFEEENTTNNWNDEYQVTSLSTTLGIHDFNTITLPPNVGDILGELTYTLSTHQVVNDSNLPEKITLTVDSYPEVRQAKDRMFNINLQHNFGYDNEYNVVGAAEDYDFKIDSQSFPIKIRQKTHETIEPRYILKSNYPDFEDLSIEQIDENTYTCEILPYYWKSKVKSVENIRYTVDGNQYTFRINVNMEPNPGWTQDYYLDLIGIDNNGEEYIIGKATDDTSLFKQKILTSIKGNDNWYSIEWSYDNVRNFPPGSDGLELSIRGDKSSTCIVSASGDITYILNTFENNNNPFLSTNILHEMAGKEYVFLSSIYDWIIFEIANATDKYVVFDINARITDETGNVYNKSYLNNKIVPSSSDNYIITENFSFNISNKAWKTKESNKQIIIIPPSPTVDICKNGSTSEIEIVYTIKYKGRDGIEEKTFKKSFEFSLEKGTFTSYIKDIVVSTDLS